MKSLAIISSQAFSLVNFRGRLIADLVANGVQVYALAPDYSVESRAQISTLGAAPIDFDLTRTGMSPWRDLHDMVELTALLRQLKPDVTLGYFIKPVIYGTLAAWLARVPHRVAMIEGLGYVFTPSAERLSWSRLLLRGGVSLLYRLALSRAHRVIFLNRDDIFDFLRIGLVELSKIRHVQGIGVDLDYWTQTDPVVSPVTFLLAARLLREKGIVEFAEAATQVKKAYPKTRFILLGADDPNPGSLDIGLVKKLVDDGILEWPGHVDLKPWMAQASVYVLPSYREGLPRSTQEAMAMGRAVITTDVPGCRETVVDGVSGFLVPVRDSAALAEAMFKFVRNPDLIVAMGGQSRRMARERFDVNFVNPHLLAILEPDADDCSTLPVDLIPEPYPRRRHGTSMMQARAERVAISVSVVSHGQIDLVTMLFKDIQRHCQGDSIELILTLNFDEFLPFDPSEFFFPVKIMRNGRMQGFSSNHNYAFKVARGDYFCVVNPDIRFDVSPFLTLLKYFDDPHVGVVAPLVLGPSGEIEDSTRMFPTPKKILKKAFARTQDRDYPLGQTHSDPDWVGGMFMLFRRAVFEQLDGFDERYYLYYEDVDICARLKLASYRAVLCPTSPIVHHAQRNSHRSMKYLRWHLGSMLRFFTSSVYRQLCHLHWI